MLQRVILLVQFQHVSPVQSLSLSCIPERPALDLGASDATYHVMWVIVFDAVDDFGIKELNDIERNHDHELGSPQVPTRMDEVRGKVFDEALRGASRIAGLVRSSIMPCLRYLFIFENLSFRSASWNQTNTWSVLLLD